MNYFYIPKIWIVEENNSFQSSFSTLVFTETLCCTLIVSVPRTADNKYVPSRWLNCIVYWISYLEYPRDPQGELIISPLILLFPPLFFIFFFHPSFSLSLFPTSYVSEWHYHLFALIFFTSPLQKIFIKILPCCNYAICLLSSLLFSPVQVITFFLLKYHSSYLPIFLSTSLSPFNSFFNEEAE